jgi:hypothetical protein
MWKKLNVWSILALLALFCAIAWQLLPALKVKLAKFTEGW